MRVKTLLIIGVLAVLIIGICGCNAPITLNGVTADQTKTQVDEYHVQVASNYATTGGTITRWQETPQGADTTRLQFAVTNKTGSMSYDLTAKLFSNKDDATKFVGENNVGYTQTVSDAGGIVWYKLDSVSLWQVQGHLITGGSDSPFVVYGTATYMPK